MKQVNIYDAKTNLSKLIDEVQSGNKIVIAKNGKPVADLSPHKPQKGKIKFGIWSNRKDISYKDADIMGVDQQVQEMFYGKDWDK